MIAYLDTSALVSVFFDEPGAEKLRRRLAAQTELVSSPLIVAEFLAVLKREDRALSQAGPALSAVSLVSFEGALRAECEEALSHGYVRGGDLWHLATALAVAGRTPRKQLQFISLDVPQATSAQKLGFSTWPDPGR